MSESQILISIFAVCLILIVVSLSGASVPSPAEWLKDWTTLLASVVATVVGARVFWKGTDAVISHIKFLEENYSKKDGRAQ